MSLPPATVASNLASPRLRSDLRVSLDGESAFIVEDPLRGQFHRVGFAEFAVLSQLDGTISLPAAAARASRGPAPAISAEKLEFFAQWLAAAQLLDTSDAPRPPRPSGLANPTYFKIPLTAGAGLLGPLTTALGWLFSWPALLAVCLATIAAAWHVLIYWTAFSASANRILCPDQHLLLAGCWLVLKLVHELGHGIASRRFGGDVREFGIAIIFFVPVPYTDVTPSWRCPRRERMIIAAAGMYFEWLVALLAVGLWSVSQSAAIQQAAVYVVGLATFATILFNANPLCRMDGYYILSDLFGLQNLAAQGQRVSRAWLSWLLLGQKPPDAAPVRRQFAIGCYGLLARLWRGLSLATMAILALLLYEGLGLLILGSIVVAWHLHARAARAAMPPAAASGPGFSFTSVLWLASIAAVLCLAAWLTPWPGGITAPGSVENAERHIVRAPCAAQVAEILVSNGQLVAAGQPIARLASDDLESELAELESAFAQGEVKQRSQRTKKQLVDWQVEQRRQASLAARITQCRQQLDSLVLRAPVAGRMVARRIADLPGSYLAEGAEVCSIASDELEFRLLIAERDLAAFAGQVGRQVQVSLSGQTVIGTLNQLDPAASTSAGESNLAASAGGPLPVVPDANSTWRLKEPRITGHVGLASPAGGRLLAGQRGFVSIRPANYSFGRRLTAGFRSWFERLSHQARQQTAVSSGPPRS